VGQAGASFTIQESCITESGKLLLKESLETFRRYEDLGQAASGGRKRSRLAVDAHLFGEHDVLSARSDLLDCQVLPRCCG